jgi:group I intron endonuclease
MIVYQAHNPVTNRYYIGKTIKPLWARRTRHAKDAEKKRTHSSFHRAIRKHGIQVFDWVVLHYADSVEEMNREEAKWIRWLNQAGHSNYNLRPGGDGGSYGGNLHPSFGKQLTKECRDKIAATLRRHYQSRPGTMTGRSGSNAPFFGLSHSDEARKKISIANKGSTRPDIKGARNPSAKAVRCITTDETFETASDACRKHGTDLSSVIRCCKGRAKSTKGLRYEYAEPGVYGWVLK